MQWTKPSGWTMSTRQERTFCRICEPGCALVATVESDKLVRLQPDKEHPVHRGFACNKGIQFQYVHQDSDRLDVPLSRRSGLLQPTTWDAVVPEIADQLRGIQDRYGHSAIAAYQGNPAAFSSATYYHATGLLRKLGCERFFSAGTQDCSAKWAASEGMYGSMIVHPYPDLLHTDYFLCIGSNPRVSHMSFIHVSNPMEKLREIKNRGGQVCFVNPRNIESANAATGEVLQLRPDTDLYFLAAVISEIAHVHGYDREWVQEHGRGFAEVLAFAKRYPVERVADVVGLKADAIKRVAREFATADSASVLMSTGVNQGRQGALCYWLVNMLSLMTGNLGKKGGNIYSPNFYPMAQNATKPSSAPYFETEFGVMRKLGNQLPANLLVDMIEDSKSPIRALIVLAGNPMLSLSGGERLRNALAGLELLIVIDLYQSSTAELADYVLPATDWLEHEDVNSLGAFVGVALEPYVQYTRAVVEPKGDRRDDWWILSKIAQALGHATLLDDEDPQPLAYLESMLSYSNLSLDALKDAPGGTVVLPTPEPKDLFAVGVQHEGRKVDCCPPALIPGWERAERIFRYLEQEHPEQLKLISRRTNYMINSWMHNVDVLKVKSHETNPLWINSREAERHGLAEGVDVEVSNENGSIRTIARIDESLRDGVVAMTHGWGNEQAKGMRVACEHPGVNVNALSPRGRNSYDMLSNQSHMTGIKVRVKSVR